MGSKEWYEENEKAIQDNWFELLKIPSVSADDKRQDQVLKAADWVEKNLKEVGLNVKRFSEGPIPVIFGERIVDPEAPTVVIYGHYDVQPEDPLELWVSGPFEPTLKDDTVFCRGAADNKGQFHHAIMAVKAFIAERSDAKVNIKMIVEGEEEIGSPNIEKMLKAHEKEVKGDYILINDMGFETFDEPTLSLGVRGITSYDIIVENQDIDCHSGEYGGAIYNPIRALTEVLGKVIDGNGRVIIDSFYEDIKPLKESEKKNLLFSRTEETVADEIGGKAFHHEVGYTLAESNTLRPTFEINGISGGYQGSGSKTVIPNKAFAKVTCRLVPDQNPEKVDRIVTDHFMKAFPSGFKVKVETHGNGRAAWTFSDTPVANVMKQAMTEVLGVPCRFSMSGGSIPLSSLLQEIVGGDFIFTGMGNPGDNIHAPNEQYTLKQYRSGFEVIFRALELFAEKSR